MELTLRQPGQYPLALAEERIVVTIQVITWRQILHKLEVVRATMEIVSTILGDKYSEFG
jgi:hypothetical protein